MMKSTGVVRKVDELGRVVIPIRAAQDTRHRRERLSRDLRGRREHNPQEVRAPLAFSVGTQPTLRMYKGKRVCKHCLEELSPDSKIAETLLKI
jgi:transcriptional pleiotropic regulator of transition state genes